ncbi:MAG: hypothetical protein ACRERD_15085 [Candidatus Binatia bacterium]
MEDGDAPLWVVRDRWDREIGLYEDAWYNHIVPGHRTLREHESAVAKVLTNPYRVMHDASHENRECFYRQRTHPSFPELFLKVCVEFESEYAGEVITAFLTPKIHADEVQRWP